MEAFFFVFIIGIIGVVVASQRNQKHKREATLSWLASQLGGRADLEHNMVFGHLAGADVMLRYVTRGTGKHRQLWTEIDAQVPEKYPLTMYVRKHGFFDRSKIEKGEMVDVLVGNALFDNTFLVEAAPADVARTLLDERARMYLLSLVDQHMFDITTHTDGGKRLRLSVRTWLDDILSAMPAIEAIAAIAGRVREAYAAVDAVKLAEVGSPYRPMLDDREARDAAESRLREVETVDQIRTQRQASGALLGVFIAVGFMVFWMLMIATR